MSQQQDAPTLVWDILYLVLDACVDSELTHSERLLDQIGRQDCWIGQLLLTSRRCRDHLLHSNVFHRLRLWRMLGKTMQHHDSVVIAVEHKNDWTLLDLKMSRQLRQRHPHCTQDVCVLTLVECRPPRRPRMRMMLNSSNSNSSNNNNNNTNHDWVRDGLVFRHKRQIVPIFSYERCLLSGVETFASHNRASIWIWRSPSNAWLYRHLKTYRLVLDNPEKELLVRNRTQQPFERLSADEQVLHHNVELFANLAHHQS